MASPMRRMFRRFTSPPKPGTDWEDPTLRLALPTVRAGGLEDGRRLLAESRSDPDRRDLRVDQFARAAVAHVDQLAALSRQHPEDPDLALWLGATRIKRAWDIRGGERASSVSAAAFEDFWLALGGVAEPLEQAARLLPEDPVPWDLLKWRGLGLQIDRVEQDDLWAELSRRAPHSYFGCYTRAEVLCAKWQGSNEEVLEFAKSVAADAPAGHPVRALLVVAHLEVAVETEGTVARYFKPAAIQEQIAAVADDWIAHAVDHLRTTQAHHLFAAAFYLGDDRARAARHLALVSPRTVPSVLPWSYCSDTPGNFYRWRRWELGLD